MPLPAESIIHVDTPHSTLMHVMIYESPVSPSSEPPPTPDSQQYLTIYADGALLVGVPLLSILLVSWVLTANLRGSLILTAVLTSLLIHLLGSMRVAGGRVKASIMPFNLRSFPDSPKTIH